MNVAIGLILILIAGVSEHFKDLSEEGKLTGYWDKNHKPMIRLSKTWREATLYDFYKIWNGTSLWWKVHWLQGGIWEYIPVWIRQYLSFRDGWHLLKFISLNLQAVGVLVIFNADWWWFFIIRVAFSLPETILRKMRISNAI